MLPTKLHAPTDIYYCAHCGEITVTKSLFPWAPDVDAIVHKEDCFLDGQDLPVYRETLKPRTQVATEPFEAGLGDDGYVDWDGEELEDNLSLGKKRC